MNFTTLHLYTVCILRMPVTDFLIYVGLIRRKDDGTIRWPVRIAPWWIWKATLRHPIRMGTTHSTWPFYVFRNCKGVIKWEEGRLLPRRWGAGFMGLIEFGDRGA